MRTPRCPSPHRMMWSRKVEAITVIHSFSPRRLENISMPRRTTPSPTSPKPSSGNTPVIAARYQAAGGTSGCPNSDSHAASTGHPKKCGGGAPKASGGARA